MISAQSAAKTIVAGGFATRYLEAGRPGPAGRPSF